MVRRGVKEVNEKRKKGKMGRQGGIGKLRHEINEEKLGGTEIKKELSWRDLHPSIWALNGNWSSEDSAVSEAVRLAGRS